MMLRFLLIALLFSGVSSTKKSKKTSNKYYCSQNCDFDSYREVEIELDYYRNNPSKFKYIFNLSRYSDSIEFIVTSEVCKFYCNNMNHISYLNNKKYYDISHIEFDDEEENVNVRMCKKLFLDTIISNKACFYSFENQTKTTTTEHTTAVKTSTTTPRTKRTKPVTTAIASSEDTSEATTATPRTKRTKPLTTTIASSEDTSEATTTTPRTKRTKPVTTIIASSEDTSEATTATPSTKRTKAPTTIIASSEDTSEASTAYTEETSTTTTTTSTTTTTTRIDTETDLQIKNSTNISTAGSTAGSTLGSTAGSTLGSATETTQEMMTEASSDEASKKKKSSNGTAIVIVLFVIFLIVILLIAVKRHMNNQDIKTTEYSSSFVYNNDETVDNEYLAPTLRSDDTNVYCEPAKNTAEDSSHQYDTVGDELYDMATTTAGDNDNDKSSQLYDMAGGGIDNNMYDMAGGGMDGNTYDLATMIALGNDNETSHLYDIAASRLNNNMYDSATTREEDSEYLKILSTMENNIQVNTDLHDHVNNFADKNNIVISK